MSEMLLVRVQPALRSDHGVRSQLVTALGCDPSSWRVRSSSYTPTTARSAAVARLLGVQEVAGAIPVGLTKEEIGYDRVRSGRERASMYKEHGLWRQHTERWF